MRLCVLHDRGRTLCPSALRASSFSDLHPSASVFSLKSLTGEVIRRFCADSCNMAIDVAHYKSERGMRARALASLSVSVWTVVGVSMALPQTPGGSSWPLARPLPAARRPPV